MHTLVSVKKKKIWDPVSYGASSLKSRCKNVLFIAKVRVHFKTCYTQFISSPSRLKHYYFLSLDFVIEEELINGM